MIIPKLYANTVYEIGFHIAELREIHLNGVYNDNQQLKIMNQLLDYKLPESLINVIQKAINITKDTLRLREDKYFDIWMMEIIESVINDPISIIYYTIFMIVKETFIYPSDDNMIIDIEKLCKEVEKSPMFVKRLNHIQTKTSRYCRKFYKWILNSITQKDYMPDVEY